MRSAHLLLPLALLLQPAAAVAQDEPPPLFVERLDVNVVNVEVWVTDQEGRRVTGLRQQDFQILEDGVPVEITNFYAVAREDRLLRQLAAPQQPAEGPAPLPPLPPEQVLHLVVLVDHLNTETFNRNRFLSDIEPFLEDRMIQGDRVMLMSFNRAVRVEQAFTGDYEQIRDGLRRMSKVTGQRSLAEVERRRRLRNMATAAEDGDLETAYQFVRSQVNHERSELRRTAQALRDVVRSLGGLPGRKALLYVSDGLPKRPGEDFYQQLVDLFGLSDFQTAANTPVLIDPYSESLHEDESALFNQITAAANAHQVTFYTVDARGTAGSSSLSADLVSVAAGNSGRSSLDAIRTTNRQETLIDLAAATGGATVFNTFNYDRAMIEVAHDFDSFYSLGYVSRQGGDGKFHKIEVRVSNPALRVRHREGYVDKPAGERVADRTLSSLVLDLEKNPLGVQIDFGRAEKKGRRRYLLPVMVRVPLRNVTLLPGEAAAEGRLRFYLVVKDEQGGISDLHEKLYPLAVPEDQLATALEQEIGYAATLLVRVGTPSVAVGVWDEVSGSDSFVHKKVRVGEP